MDAETLFKNIAAEEDWERETQIGVLLGYIKNQHSDAAFADYLNEHRKPDYRTWLYDLFGCLEDMDIIDTFDHDIAHRLFEVGYEPAEAAIELNKSGETPS